MAELKGKVAIVTGGARGLGRAISVKLAEGGALVYIFDIGDCGWTLEEIAHNGNYARAFNVDITNSSDVKEAVDDVYAARNRIDILVNNAGIVSTHENILSVSNDIWDKEIKVNLTGSFYTSRAVLSKMIPQNSGKIINISSLAGDTGRIQTSPAYAAAKTAVYGLTMSMARSVAKYGINVNAVCPGIMLTDITKAYPEDILEELLSEVPYPRGGRPEDIGEAVYFLASKGSDYINGARIRVNGGSWMG